MKPGPKRISILERFLQKIVVNPDGCWHWTGMIDPKTGYGVLGAGGYCGKPVYVHRLAYETWIGSIPEGFTVDHQCHNVSRDCRGGPSCLHRRCVNPEHLEAVTHKTNLARGKAPAAIAVRTGMCKRGHPFTTSSTQIKKNGARQCKICQAEWYQQNKSRLEIDE